MRQTSLVWLAVFIRSTKQYCLVKYLLGRWKKKGNAKNEYAKNEYAKIAFLLLYP